jgi:hypothetical protein
MIEQARGPVGNDWPVTYWPDHWAPMTWHRCVVEGCAARLDPWDHVTRCPRHQADEDARRARVRAIVQANREAGRESVRQ